MLVITCLGWGFTAVSLLATEPTLLQEYSLHLPNFPHSRSHGTYHHFRKCFSFHVMLKLNVYLPLLKDLHGFSVLFFLLCQRFLERQLSLTFQFSLKFQFSLTFGFSLTFQFLLCQFGVICITHRNGIESISSDPFGIVLLFEKCFVFSYAISFAIRKKNII